MQPNSCNVTLHRIEYQINVSIKYLSLTMAWPTMCLHVCSLVSLLFLLCKQAQAAFEEFWGSIHLYDRKLCYLFLFIILNDNMPVFESLKSYSKSYGHRNMIMAMSHHCITFFKKNEKKTKLIFCIFLFSLLYRTVTAEPRYIPNRELVYHYTPNSHVLTIQSCFFTLHALSSYFYLTRKCTFRVTSEN